MNLRVQLYLKGGPGSGHRGHAGRPGKQGGSLPSGVAVSIRTGRAAAVRAGWKPSVKPKPKEPVVKPGQALGKWESLEGEAAVADAKASAHLSDGVKGGWIEHAEGEDARIKVEVARSLMMHTDKVLAERGLAPMEPGEATAVLHQWANVFSDSRPESSNAAIAEEFGVKLSDWQKGIADESIKPLMPRARERAILRGMYNNTQEELRKAGYKSGDTVKLFRGMQYAKDEAQDMPHRGSVAYKGNNLESWTVSHATANMFAEPEVKWRGAVLGISVPVENVLGTARTGFGCLGEGEFVIFGSVPGTKVSVEKFMTTIPRGGGWTVEEGGKTYVVD